MLHKKIIFLTLLTSSLIPLSTYAATAMCSFNKQTIEATDCVGPATITATSVKGPLTVKGPLKASQANFTSIEVAGMAQVTDASIKDNLTVMGKLELEKSTVGSLSVKGNAKLDRSTVYDDAQIMGALSASKTSFDKSIMIESNLVELSSANVRNDIVVQSTNTQPVVSLMCHSSVGGSVNFKKNAGIVKVSSDSSVGKIENGEKQAVENTCANE